MLASRGPDGTYTPMPPLRPLVTITGVPSPAITRASASCGLSAYLRRYIVALPLLAVVALAGSFHSTTPLSRFSSLSPMSPTQMVPSGAMAMSSVSRV